ncbi:MAG: hypothetical protein E7559_02195 [Ruminococcaceae bacterium]|nr:hypothetical protein [Oscillospiraceae bacterium]
MKDKRKVIAIIAFSVVLIASVIGYFLLPETLVVQVAADGSAGNTMPKLPALLIAPALCAIGSFLYVNDITNDTGLWNNRAIIIIVSLIVSAATYIFNL